VVGGLGEEGIEGGPDSVEVVVDRDDDQN
jgi:hypothetical protein